MSIAEQYPVENREYRSNGSLTANRSDYAKEFYTFGLISFEAKSNWQTCCSKTVLKNVLVGYH